MLKHQSAKDQSAHWLVLRAVAINLPFDPDQLRQLRRDDVLTGTLADLGGTHTWSGKTCDGTALGLTYTVNADGTVSYVSATGGTVTTHAFDKGFIARFSGMHAFVNVSIHQNEQAAGTYALKVRFQRYGCGTTPVPDPIVNTTVQPDASQGGLHSNRDQTKQGGLIPGSKYGQRP